jgi:uncharacterized integral membrane protein
MKGLFWIAALPLAAIAGLFAVANRHLVMIDLWPLSGHVDLPLFIALAGALYAGFVLGALIAWAAAGKARARARAATRRADALERELAVLQHRFETTPPVAPLPGKSPDPVRLTAERVDS